MPIHPEIRRVSYADHVRAATDAGRKADPDRAIRMVEAASQLPSLHAIQVSLDALARTAQGYNDGKPDPYGLPLSYHVADALKHAEYHRDVLKAGHDAAESMLADIKSQTTSLEKTMKDRSDAHHPKLTADGSPHPLEEGGYDANNDPALPGNISDTEALKEGKATRQQVEAIGKADAKETDGHAKTDADGFPSDSSDAEKKAKADADAKKADDAKETKPPTKKS